MYSLLESYAKKTHSPYININNFIHYLNKTAKSLAADHAEWVPWTTNIEGKVWEALPELVKEEKCKITTTLNGSQIFLSSFYINLIHQVYMLKETGEAPFPDEKYFKLNIARDQVRTLYIENELAAYLDNPQEALLPLIRLTFPRDLPNIIILSSLIPKQLGEIAMFKIQSYLWAQGNKEHIQNRLISHFQGKEDYLRDMINYIMTKPINCLSDIQSGGDLSFLFWSFFCNLIKSEVNQKNELIPQDTAVLQAVYILEIFNNYYKTKVVRAKERETALKNLSLCFDKPPYLYTMAAIIKFTNKQGIPLLGRYSQEDLETFLKTNTTEHTANELPELLVVHDLDEKQFFIKKAFFLPLCSQLLNETRPQVKKTISEQWFKLLKAYDQEPAMEKNEDFEKLLFRIIKNINPMVISLFRDPRLVLVYDELKNTQESDFAGLFDKGKLRPFSALLKLNRKELLADTRMLLPFWYSIAFMVRIITFFKNAGKKKSSQNHTEDPDLESFQNNNPSPSLKELTAEFVPPGSTLAQALAEQEARWNTRLNSQARKDLETDVNALIMDRLRQLMRLPKKPRITREFLDQTALAFISEIMVLQQLSNPEALGLYIKLYIINLLQNKKI
ncbi:MAG: hypothetical protein LBL19_03425 [Spirochaetaceae bacterium]|nr:hypothetical protein [Spirochaetaceae bacterium]